MELFASLPMIAKFVIELMDFAEVVERRWILLILLHILLLPKFWMTSPWGSCVARDLSVKVLRYKIAHISVRSLIEGRIPSDVHCHGRFAHDQHKQGRQWASTRPSQRRDRFLHLSSVLDGAWSLVRGLRRLSIFCCVRGPSWYIRQAVDEEWSSQSPFFVFPFRSSLSIQTAFSLCGFTVTLGVSHFSIVSKWLRDTCRILLVFTFSNLKRAIGASLGKHLLCQSISV